MTPAALACIEAADLVIGYQTYLKQIAALLQGKESLAYPMTTEVARAQMAVDAARSGRNVVMISGGDPGVFGMAGPVLEVAARSGLDVRIEPGITAATAAASRLGAPLMQDVALISLSDRLTPWSTIMKRIRLAAEADLVLVFYNPSSQGRVRQIGEVRAELLTILPGTTPVGIVRNAFRDDETVLVSDLQHFLDHPVDMATTLIVGNRATAVWNGRMITPRGYRL
ncbi:precorrin-3B C17-methyltransferase [Hydrogenispora ethanolica]|uniref:Precorrin-3B C17-methyltransferase n=1 Tax=Hydrogenispora ethanolica TaxID=1082276 RepID=A0A4R1S4A8_HYDET|nr:precorrin-3B C(17)-methyltransferase [Hydrogenispora ethanolica]TCL74075.1 precorrin-3B C17-methyltransferase [Hydrogenispora ethanolica]